MHGDGISLLVPFRGDRRAPDRIRIWRWLQRYWAHELPGAEIVVGRSRHKPFSKTEAVNNAARRATGDIFVILDSDCYIPGAIVADVAERIRASERLGEPLWFIPYRHIYRLTQASTKLVLASDPADPYRFPTPPDYRDVESTLGSGHGHHFGALIQVMPRSAFEMVGGMDERFSGWGGEDVSFVRALDTLYGNHKTTDSDVLHLWHYQIGVGFKERQWEGQKGPRANEKLAQRYNLKTNDRIAMWELIGERFKPRRRWWKFWRR